MRRALRHARRGWGRVHPNPMVGAVVVRDGTIVGEGFHAEYGGPHAEVAALAAAGAAAEGATLYVTLEPCAHHGKTPPCTDALIAADIRRVVYASADPDPRAAGGADVLRRHGVEVLGGIEAEAARALNAGFLHVHERNEPFVALKLALSLDAKLGRTRRAPTPITGPEARAEVHRLRAGFDAILVGIGTALADDPLLTARGDIEPRVPPIRVVADSSLRMPATARMLTQPPRAPVWVATTEAAPAERARALENAGARILRIPDRDGRIDASALVDRLWSEGLRTILCEGGGTLAVSLLAADRVARLVLFHAPLFLGGDVQAFPPAASAPPHEPDAWRLIHTGRVGRDALAVWDRRS